MSLDFKNRIALYYLLATATVVAFVFCIVFVIVKTTVYQSVDNDLLYEANLNAAEVILKKDGDFFINKEEWTEREHQQAQVNPVFIQLVDKNGTLKDKSPNLHNEQLSFDENQEMEIPFSSFLHQTNIRLVQIPIKINNQTKGYILTAMSFEASQTIISTLKNILLFSYPIIIFILFFISRFLAGRSIKPIKNITQTTNKISKHSLSERVELPENKDELYELSFSINQLLNRIENAFQRERQFTSDASHELRTPIASIRGNLEVLIRKKRTQEEYHEKITYTLSEIDRMTTIIDQLLFLARFDENQPLQNENTISLIPLIDDILFRHKKEIQSKKLVINFEAEENVSDFKVPEYYANTILDNLITNAIKYSRKNEKIDIGIKKADHQLICRIKDYGIGIKQEDLEKIAQPFFRSDALLHKDIAGTGLGLSIVKKAAEAIDAELFIESTLNEGSTFNLIFKPILRND